MEYHCHFKTVISISTLISAEGQCLLTSQMFENYVTLFRNTFPNSNDNNSDILSQELNTVSSEKDFISEVIDDIIWFEDSYEMDHNEENISSSQANNHLKLSLFGYSACEFEIG